MFESCWGHQILKGQPFWLALLFFSGGVGKTAQGAGNNAAGYGAGGGGALSTGTAYTGGTGAPGIIIVREFS